MKKARIRILEDMLISREKIKTDSNSLRLENTAEDLQASISCIESNKLEQESREGYNYFKNYSYNNDSVIDAGITVKLQKNGKILVNGTSTQDVWFEIMYALQSRNFYAK